MLLASNFHSLLCASLLYGRVVATLPHLKKKYQVYIFFTLTCHSSFRSSSPTRLSFCFGTRLDFYRACGRVGHSHSSSTFILLCLLTLVRFPSSCFITFHRAIPSPVASRFFVLVFTVERRSNHYYGCDQQLPNGYSASLPLRIELYHSFVLHFVSSDGYVNTYLKPPLLRPCALYEFIPI